MTQLTLDTDLTTYQRDSLNIVHSLANNLLTIIDDILDLSKIEAQRMDLENIPFSLRSMVFDALKSVAVKANERSLNLAYEIDGSVPDYIRGDSFRLRQIIINLVGNAIKFTEHGQVKVQICGSSSREKSNCSMDEYCVQFAVSDTGIGIHSEKLNLIFDSFQQADGSTTRKFGGTGLGLSISRKLVNLMGGDIWIESVYGHGSTFFFTCRVRRAPPDLIALRPQLQPFRDHAVLFIDQGVTGCTQLLTSAIRDLGLVPIVTTDEYGPATGGARSVEMPVAYDCVLVDSEAAARRLRGVERFKYIPIVVVAPRIDISFKSALEDGVSAYMTTPCLPIDLGNALLPALQGRATPTGPDASRSFDILLAEDNMVNQRLAVKILQKYHHTVTVANNGLEALEAIMKRRFDVVLMDVQMPIMFVILRTFQHEGHARLIRSHTQGRLRSHSAHPRVGGGACAAPHANHRFDSTCHAGGSREVHTGEHGRQQPPPFPRCALDD